MTKREPLTKELLQELEEMVDNGLELYPDDPGFNLTKDLIEEYKSIRRKLIEIKSIAQFALGEDQGELSYLIRRDLETIIKILRSQQ